MMQTQVLDTMGRDGPDSLGARVPARTLRSAVVESSPIDLVVATVGVIAAMCAALSPSVPLAATVPVAAMIGPALVDRIDHRLPNRMVAAAAVAGVVVAIVTVMTGGEVDPGGAALGAVAFAGPLLVMHLVSPSSMGFGDVKTACVLGAALGLVDPLHGLTALAAGSLLGAAAGLLGRRRTIAFGPALVGGAIVALMLAAAPVDVFERPAATLTEVPTEHSSEELRQ